MRTTSLLLVALSLQFAPLLHAAAVPSNDGLQLVHANASDLITPADAVALWDMRTDPDNAKGSSAGDVKLAKRGKRFGGCFGWPANTNDNVKTTYFGQYLSAQVELRKLSGATRIFPNDSVTWEWGTVRVHIRNQNQCFSRWFLWPDVVHATDDIWHLCTNRALGWSFINSGADEDLVVIVQWTGMGIPPYSSTCSGIPDPNI